jgi:hypothetical protein
VYILTLLQAALPRQFCDWASHPFLGYESPTLGKMKVKKAGIRKITAFPLFFLIFLWIFDTFKMVVSKENLCLLQPDTYFSPIGEKGEVKGKNILFNRLFLRAGWTAQHKNKRHYSNSDISNFYCRCRRIEVSKKPRSCKVCNFAKKRREERKGLL